MQKGFMERILEGWRQCGQDSHKTHWQLAGSVSLSSPGKKIASSVIDALVGLAQRAEVPSLYHFTAALDRWEGWEFKRSLSDSDKPRASDWVLFSVDVKGAHKSIRTHPDDIGFAVFHFEDEFFVYLVNHFGGSWSAHWWARLASMLMRLLHLAIRHKYIAAVYVDDYLFLLHRDCFLPIGVLIICFLVVIGVPLSWSKLALGEELSYLGWKLSVKLEFTARLPEDKMSKLRCQLVRWIRHPWAACRSELQQCVGLLVWATQVCLMLRPFLAPIFQAIHRHRQTMKMLNWQ